MKRIGIIIGSVREPRRGLTVGKWVLSQANDRNASYDIVDLRDINLPHYNEPGSPRTNQDYTHAKTRMWSDTIKQYDAFVFVTPEYNGFFPGAIKDAVDFLYHEWTNKPFAIVGYGGRGAKWASQHLATLLKRFDMPDSGYVGIHKPAQSIDDQGNIDPEFIDGSLSDLFNTLEFNMK